MGSTKWKDNIETIITESSGSRIAAGNKAVILSEKDTSIKGSTVHANDILLKAGNDLNILSSQNKKETIEKTKGSSTVLGASITKGGYGISASYGKGNGQSEETGITHNLSQITAADTITADSRNDIKIAGGTIRGNKVTIESGRNLDIQSEQDTKTYTEKNRISGIGISYIPGSHVSVNGGAGKTTTDSNYESVTTQSGIYAGEKGYDIKVQENTHLKGAVIASRGNKEKNNITTGTLSWENIDNKAEYKTDGQGGSYTNHKGTPLNSSGLLTNLTPTVKNNAKTTTISSISQGTITVIDKEKQKQNIIRLNRNTGNNLNKLKNLFDKTKVKERKELIQEMSIVGNRVIHEIAAHNYWKDGSQEKILLHGALSTLTGTMSGDNGLTGAIAGGVNEFAVGYIEKIKGKIWMVNHADTVQAISTALGTVVGGVTGDKVTGAYTSQMGIKWNYLGFELPEFEKLLVENLKNPDGTAITKDQAKHIQDTIINAGNKWDTDGAMSDIQLETGNQYALAGTVLSLKNKYESNSVDKLMTSYKKMVADKQMHLAETKTYEIRPMNVSSVKEHGFDAYLIQGGVGNFGVGYIYDFKMGKSYYSFGVNKVNGISPIDAEVAGLHFVSIDPNYNLSIPENREKLLTGSSIGGSIYIGLGGGVSTPIDQKIGKIWIYKYGIGLPQIGISGDYTDSLNDKEVDK